MFADPDSNKLDVYTYHCLAIFSKLDCVFPAIEEKWATLHGEKAHTG